VVAASHPSKAVVLARAAQQLSNARGRTREGAYMAKSITSPIAGQVIQCLVKVGDLVQPDTEIAIVEAMKMHIPVSAEQGGRVMQWLVAEKSTVAEGQALLTLEG
jgi:acetyl-CoA carboxylase biotin carboxyl carrier protein